MVSRDSGRERDPLVRPVDFELGRTLMTPDVQQQVPPSELLQALRRHARGDWGDIHPDDKGANERALQEGARLLSVYQSKAGVKFWIITEADLSATTALLPDEY